MTQQQSVTDISPVSIGIGALALAEVADALAALLTYVYGRRPKVHLSLGLRNVNLTTRPPLDVFFPASGGWRTIVSTQIFINADTVNLVLGVVLQFDVPGDAGRVRFTVGGAAATIAGDDTDNDTELLATLATSATGTGARFLTIEIERTAGTGQACPYEFSVQDEAITSGFPDPSDD